MNNFIDFTGKKAAIFLILLSLFLFIPGFFTLPAVDRDESRYAQASKQMIESSNFIDIRFQDEPRHKKPVGIYWMQSIAANLFDDKNKPRVWAYRIPSLIGAIVAVLLTWVAGTYLFNSRAGMLSGLMVAGCLMVGYEARQAKTDAVLLASIMAAQTILAIAWVSWQKKEKLPSWMAYLFWMSVGLSALVKGPIILIICGGAVIFLGVWKRSWCWLKTLRPISGVFITLAIILPWFLAIGVESQGAFFKEAVGHDLLKKVYSGQESHGAPPGYYIITFWATFWPFALLAGFSARLIWHQRENTSVAFCIAWVLPTWLIFEVIITKLPHYMLPLFPAVAILTSGMISDKNMWSTEKRGVIEWISIVSTGIVTLGMMVVLIIGASLIGDNFSIWSIVGLAGLVWVLILLCRITMDRTLTVRLFPQILLATIIFTGSCFSGFFPSLKSLWMSPRIAEVVSEYRRENCEDAVLHAVGYHEPSLIFQVGTDTVLTNSEGAVAALEMKPNCTVAVIGDRDLEHFNKLVVKKGLNLHQLAEIQGFNYSRGQKMMLRLFSGS